MDLAFSQEQEMLSKSARDFLANKCSKALVREMEEEEQGYSPELWVPLDRRFALELSLIHI